MAWIYAAILHSCFSIVAAIMAVKACFMLRTSSLREIAPQHADVVVAPAASLLTFSEKTLQLTGVSILVANGGQNSSIAVGRLES